VPTFDYITDKQFRESLLSDHAEMQQSFNSKAWKSVLVLAGSMVETLLIDYLASTKNPQRAAKDPLKLTLAEAIETCQKEGVLTERSADLCSVVKSYRNLIHPGRAVRLKEKPADRGSATIAVTLVNMITEELSEVLRKAVGLTAEQIVSKIKRDANVLTILKHLLVEISEQEQQRLLVTIIPSEHDTLYTLGSGDGDDAATMVRLARAFRVIVESATEPVRTRVASEFVRIIREEDGDTVLSYGRSFFRPSDLSFVSEPQRAMVKDHLLGRVTGAHTSETLDALAGIANYLEVADVSRWLDPYLQTILSTGTAQFVKLRCRRQIMAVASMIDDAVDTAISERFDSWIEHLDGRGATADLAVVRQLKEEYAGSHIPF